MKPATKLRLLTIAGIALALGSAGLGAALLLEARHDTWRQAQQASQNLVIAIERDIARNLNMIDLSLQGAIQAWRVPGLDRATPELRQLALFDRTASAAYLGSVLLLGPDGRILDSSAPVTGDVGSLADRDYFRIHQNQQNAGLYVSQPFRSRLRNGDPSMAISRALPGPDSRPAGVAVGVLRLAYFQDLFARLDLGELGAVSLVRTDGMLLARHPSSEADLSRNVSGSEMFRRLASAPAGQFVSTAVVDGVERFYTYRRIADLPLVLSLGLSTREVYAAWWQRAHGIGFTLTLLCAAAILLTLMFRREMLRRMAAEAELSAAAGRLAVMASTDGLTGLANRREFDARLSQDWGVAIRQGATVSLLLIDADHFKSFNDTQGHPAGDEVLRAIAHRIQAHLRRPGDCGARYGGEEFGVLLPSTDADGAKLIAERIRASVAGLGIPHGGSPAGRVTVSIGVATATPQRGETPERLIEAADEALYEAKRRGRNRVCGPRPGGLPGTVLPFSGLAQPGGKAG